MMAARFIRPARIVVVLIALAMALAACREDAAESSADAGASDAASEGADALVAPDTGPPLAEADAAPPPEPPRCPPDMVLVAKTFCVDRYEAMFVAAKTGQAFSPYYPPSRRLAAHVEKVWDVERLKVGGRKAQQTPLPPLPPWVRTTDFEPRAVSKNGVTPQGYTTGIQAALACKNAGKRLCTLSEWRTACRGEKNQQFPYGAAYARGRCNVFRETHPAGVLHDDVSSGHNDPRLNLVEEKGRPLLRKTGGTPACLSEWDGDAIADMVGNLDEWIDNPEGTFVGGFYARSTKEGCDSIISSHSFDYSDYSTGTRCCADLAIGVPPVAP